MIKSNATIDDSLNQWLGCTRLYSGDQWGTELQATVSVIKVDTLAILQVLSETSVRGLDSFWLNALFCNSFDNLRHLNLKKKYWTKIKS